MYGRVRLSRRVIPLGRFLSRNFVSYELRSICGLRCTFVAAAYGVTPVKGET